MQSLASPLIAVNPVARAAMVLARRRQGGVGRDMSVLGEWTFAVEAGKIAEFRRAVGGPMADVAPPTFTMVAGAEWVERLVMDVLRLDRGRTVHGEQVHDYSAPIRAGMVLRCQASLVSDVVKLGRAGPMRVVTVAVDHSDAATGASLLRETLTMIEQGAVPPPDPNHRGSAPTPQGDGGQVGADGDVVFGPVTRTDLVRYAGASGDFNPLHHDPDFARAAGLPDVIAHGMYSAGLVAGHLERRYGAMTRYAVRFRAPVQVGDRLALSCELVGNDLTLTLRRGDDTVLSGTATLRPDPETT